MAEILNMSGETIQEEPSKVRIICVNAQNKPKKGEQYRCVIMKKGKQSEYLGHISEKVSEVVMISDGIYLFVTIHGDIYITHVHDCTHSS